MKKILILAVCALAPASVSAEQWQILGTRPMGMGGAFVAVAQGPIAQYWNPAGLAIESSKTVSGLEIPVTAGIEATGGILKNASDIGNMATQLNAIQAAQTAGAAITPAQAADFVKTMSLLNAMTGSGKGALVEANGGANFKFSKVTVSVNNFTAVGLNPYIDVNNLNLGNGGTSLSSINFGGAANTTPTDPSFASAASQLATALPTNIATLLCGSGGCGSSISSNAELANVLANYAYTHSIPVTDITQAASQIAQYANTAAPVIAGALSGGSYTANTSNLTLDAASFTEVAFGYGKYFKFLEGLSMGANLKAINGRMAYSKFEFMNNSQTGDAFKNMMDDSKSTWQPGVDFGAMWDINKKYPKAPMSPKVGLVVRNINSPKFDRPAAEGGTYTLDRQARMGLSFKPANFWNVAMDMDLTKNSTEVKGFDSRQFALGTEFNLINKKAFNIPLRAGIMKNTAEKDSKLAYTLGTGLNLLYMHFDVGAAISSDRTTLDDKKIPTKATVSASFGLLF